jgi:hypothetical protein
MRMNNGSLALISLCLAVWFLPSAALAQTACTATSTPTERFACASQAAEDGLWEDALHEFQQLYAQTHAPSALFNVGIAFQSLGRHREARDAFDLLMREHAAELDDETRNEAARQYGTEARRVARLRLFDVPRDDESVRVRLDGRTVSIADGEPLELEADPGAHGVTVSETGHSDFDWEGALSDGQALELHVLLPALPSTPHEIYEDWGFWVAVVVGACAIAGASVLGWWLQEDAQLDPRGGFVIPVGR